MNMFQCKCGEEVVYNSPVQTSCEDCRSVYYITTCLSCNTDYIFEEELNSTDWICDDCKLITKAENFRQKTRSKGPEFAICKDPSYFTKGITDEYPISYRLVILNILFTLFQNSTIDRAIIKQDLIDLLVAIINNKEYHLIKYNDYFHVYTFKNIHNENLKEIYAVIIDKTRAITPLFFYYNSSSIEKKKFRVEALKASLNEIVEKFDLFESIFSDNEQDFREHGISVIKDVLCLQLNTLNDEDY